VKGRVWSTAAVAAVAGILLVWATAKLDSSRFWDLSISRSGAIEKAREVAATYGLDASHWKAQVRSEYKDRARRFQEIRKASKEENSADLLSSAFFVVDLKDLEGEDRLEVEIDGRGGLRSFSLRPFRSAEATLAAPQEVAKAAASRALEALARPAAAEAWKLVETRDVGEDSWRFQWQPEGPELPGVLWRAEATTRDGVAHDFEVDPILEAVPPRRNRQEDLQGLVNLLLLLAVLVYVVQTQRYRHPHRNAITLGWVTMLVGTVASLARTGPLPLGKVSILATSLGTLLDPILLRSVGTLLLFAAGCAAGRRWFPRAVAPFETLLTRDWWSRPVARSVSRGVASGLVLALVFALAVAIVRAFGGPQAATLVASDPETTAARWPFLAALVPRLELAFLGYFGFLLPLAAGLFRRPSLARILAAPVGALVLVPLVPVEGAPLLVLGMALLMVGALDQVYGRMGLLAVLVAAWASGAAARGAGLAVQSGLLSLFGWITLALLVGIAYGSSARSRRPTASEGLAPEAMPLPLRLRAERERIKAQLGVAQEAQARMLPAAPPEIPGWSLAAVCRPAREGGGDLYDFLPGPEGRWGILVGDVSGKGMVASLYMTLTKGLVLATSEETQAPAEVLVAVNEGLHQETERGVFVTAWLGLLDPATGRLEHARAGHNPLIWRRARLRETVALTPKGLPLGAVGNRMFAPALEEDLLQVEPGDSVFVYSDGLSEAMDGDRNEYGEERLIATIGRTDGLSAERARDVVMADVDAFVGAAPQHDDMTLLVLHFKPAS